MKPSEEKDVCWLRAFRRQGVYPESVRPGKWLIFVREHEVDTVWEKIALATEQGLLGDAAKVSTAKPRSDYDRKIRVICVYTYDWKDEEDVHRVRQALRELGIDWRLRYKTDEDTLTGKYSRLGYRHIAKYFE